MSDHEQIEAKPFGWFIEATGRPAFTLDENDLKTAELFNWPVVPLYKEPRPVNAPDEAVLVEALTQIALWCGFPSTGKVWEESGEPVSYGAAYGSNGERDFMRGVASGALAAYRKQGGD